MIGRNRNSGLIFVLALGLVSTAVARDVEADPAPQLSKLAPDERILVANVRDYLTRGEVSSGSGTAVKQAVYNALRRFGHSPVLGSFFQMDNVLEESRSLGCAYVVRPTIERYTSRNAPRSRVELSVDLLETISGEKIASCSHVETVWGMKERVQELLRPVVEGCFAQMLEPTDNPASVGDVAHSNDRFVVVPLDALWVLPSDADDGEGTALEEASIDRVLHSLRRAHYEGVRGESGLTQHALFAQAREDGHRQMLAVGVGVIWTEPEPPPPDAPPQLILSLIDVATKQRVQTILASTTDRSWTDQGLEQLPALVEAALHGILESRATPQENREAGISLSRLEPVVLVRDKGIVLSRSARRLSGVVEVALVVDERGEVTDVRVLESVPGLDKPVISATRRMRFVPARRDGEVCCMHLRRRVEFESD